MKVLENSAVSILYVNRENATVQKHSQSNMYSYCTCSRWLLFISECLRVARMLNIKGEFLTTRLIRELIYLS